MNAALYDPWTVHRDPLFTLVARALSGPAPLETAAAMIENSDAPDSEKNIARREWLAKYREIYGDFECAP